MAYGNSFQRTTPAVLNLIIINAIVFVAQQLIGKADPEQVYNMFAMHHYLSPQFRWYQMITHMFMHLNFMHLLVNMFGLWMFGSLVEKVWGAKRFLIFYLVCGLGAALFEQGIFLYEHQFLNPTYFQQDLVSVSLGASGAIMGVLAAFGYLFPNSQMMIIPIPVPVKAKWVVLGIIAIDLFSGIARNAGDNVAHFAHVGGAVTGFLIVYFQNKMNRKTFY
jgi:membrane associated rhomboid family serine protease